MKRLKSKRPSAEADERRSAASEEREQVENAPAQRDQVRRRRCSSGVEWDRLAAITRPREPWRVCGWWKRDGLTVIGVPTAYGVKWHSMPPPLSGPGRADPKSRLAAWQSEKQSGQAAPRSRRAAKIGRASCRE